MWASICIGGNITYQVEGKPYEGYFVLAKAAAPLILLIHDWDGLTQYEKKRAHMLEKLGYSVFAADLFGKGNRPTLVKDKKQHTGELYKDRRKMRALMEAAIAVARKNGAQGKKVVAMGYCFGGAAVLELARSGANLAGFASFHGGLKTPAKQSYAKARGRIMVFHGSADTNITMQDFANLTSELEEHKVSHELITYSGAPHAFTVFGSDRYRKEADQKSWKRFTQFLQEEV